MSRWRELYFERRVARAAGRLVVVVDRHLADVAREGDRQLAARVDLAEHDVGDGVAGLDAAEPGLEDRRRGGVDLRQRQRPAVEQHDRERLAGRLDRVDHCSCWRPGRSRFDARLGLAAHLARLADGEHDLVGGLRGRDGGGEPSTVGHSPAGSSRSLWVSVQPGVYVVFGFCGLDAGEERDGVLVAAAAPPRAEHVVPRLSPERADRPRSSWPASSGSALPSFLSSTIERAGGRARGGAVGRQQLLVWRVGDVDVGMLEQPGAELDRAGSGARRRRCASSTRGRVATSCLPKSR